jgi:DNA replication and repair protein RecF
VGGRTNKKAGGGLRFSERIGYRQIKSLIQIDSIDDELLNGLWNAILWFYYSKCFVVDYHTYVNRASLRELTKKIWVDFFKEPLDTINLDTEKPIMKIRDYMFSPQTDWFEKYDLLEMYDIPLVKEGLEIQKRRKKAIFKFNTIFTSLYKDISGIDGVKIAYEPSWKTEDESEILDYLLSKREADKVMGTTMTGPHRDKIYFIKDGKNFISTASTGQRRLISLILRIAQATYYTEITGKNPILLMDDVLLELDPNKRQSVTALLPKYDQLFCTFLPGEPYEKYKHSTTRIYKIENGAWYE